MFDDSRCGAVFLRLWWKAVWIGAVSEHSGEGAVHASGSKAAVRSGGEAKWAEKASQVVGSASQCVCDTNWCRKGKGDEERTWLQICVGERKRE